MMHELKDKFERQASGVIEVISPNDIQYRGQQNRAYYFSAGQSGLRCIKLALLAAGKEHVRNLLDLPCGHGRVMRTLRAAFPEAQLTACDLDRDAVDFCSRVFDATPIYSKPQPEQLEIRNRFDLIWCGSLLTHLDMDRWAGFLKLFSSILSPGGVLVFTAHGRYVAERLCSRTFTYGLTQSIIDQILEDYGCRGFGYGDYPNQSNYGISLSLPSWVCTQLEKSPDLHLLNYTERGFNRHQDVIACVRVSD
jgi:SAM-dependent methyltransferase